MRLFVDVDDTLILWSKDAKDGSFVTKYEPNEAVIHFIRTFRQVHPGHEVVVWSTGGADYARKHAEEQLPEMYDRVSDKYNKIPQVGDLFLDDDPLPTYRTACIHRTCCDD
jgi:hypothetical protein